MTFRFFLSTPITTSLGSGDTLPNHHLSYHLPYEHKPAKRTPLPYLLEARLPHMFPMQVRISRRHTPALLGEEADLDGGWLTILFRWQ